VELARWVEDARRRTLALYGDLDDAQIAVPYLEIINPPIWELGHVAFFQQFWVLRDERRRELYDSARVAHRTRWSLPLPSRAETVAYLEETAARVLARLDEVDPYFVHLSVFHEDMHDEAFAYTRQTLGLPPPPFAAEPRDASGPLPGDAQVPGGRFLLGAEPGDAFVFDNEKWAHPVEVAAFAIARAPVTQAAFAAFVDDGGYRRRELWTEAGWAWREAAGAERPLTWSADGGHRRWDRWLPLEPERNRPMLHVNAHEAEAWCRWAGRRLPTEAEWELAAGGPERRRFPWGDDPPTPERAHLDFTAHGTVDVAACPAGDSPYGCRQMIGNVWEWTASPFVPYPGFVVDPYQEYSEPWFHTHRVLRGGCFVTRGRLLRNSWRNFYPPDRRDVWAGFRTCAL